MKKASRLVVLAGLLASAQARAVTGPEAVARAQQWVNAGMPYCQVPYGGCDSHVCCGAGYRPENPDWDGYRSDCSGLVSWAWALGGPGPVTWEMAPFDTSFSFEIDATQLQPGDALNSNEHVMLFAGWVDYLVTADLIDESDWGTPAQERQIGVSVSGSQVTRNDWTSNPFTAIRLVGLAPPDAAPVGFLDQADCDAVAGWSQDADAPAQSLSVDLYFGGPAGSGAPGVRVASANDRADLCSAIGSCNHGFSLGVPRSLLDGAAHEVHAYGIDANGSANAELASSPRTLSGCAPQETGVRRHVTDPTSYAAWAFDAFQDVRHLDDATFASWAAASPLPASPQLVQAAGDPAVWLLDGAFKRHVPSPEVMTAWRLSWSAIAPIDASALAAMPQGPDLRPRPQLIQGSGPEVDVLDDPLPTPAVVDAGPAEVEVPDAGHPPAVVPSLDAGPAAVLDAGSAEVPVVDPPVQAPVTAPAPGAGGELRGGCQSFGGLDALALASALGALSLRRRRFGPSH